MPYHSVNDFQAQYTSWILVMMHAFLQPCA